MKCDEASKIQKGNKPFNIIFQGAEQSQGISKEIALQKTVFIFIFPATIGVVVKLICQKVFVQIASNFQLKGRNVGRPVYNCTKIDIIYEMNGIYWNSHARSPTLI